MNILTVSEDMTENGTKKKIVQNVTFFLSFYFIIFILCFNFNMCLVVKVS